jgi:hypothetical protein
VSALMITRTIYYDSQSIPRKACTYLYSRGRAPSSGFSDWPAQQKTTKKKTEKKGRPLKFFIHRSKLQAATSDDDHHTESQLIRAITRPRPTSACSGQLAQQWGCEKKGGGEAGGDGDIHRSLSADFSQKCLLMICNGGRRILTVDLFFSLFFVARADQKIRNLALGRQSTRLYMGTLEYRCTAT